MIRDFLKNLNVPGHFSSSLELNLSLHVLCANMSVLNVQCLRLEPAGRGVPHVRVISICPATRAGMELLLTPPPGDAWHLAESFFTQTSSWWLWNAPCTEGKIKAADTTESSESSGISLMRQCNRKQASPRHSPPGPWAFSPQTGFPPQRTETPGSPSGWTEGWRTALDSSPPDAGPSGGDRGTPQVPGWKSARGRRPESLNSSNQLTPNHATNLTQLLHHQEMLKLWVFMNSSILQEWGWQDEGNAKFPAPGGTRSSLTWFWLRLISMACSSETSEGTFWILLRDRSSRSRCLKAPSLGGNSDNWFPDRLRVRRALSWPRSEGSCWMWFPFRLRVSSFFSLQISGGRHAEDTQTDTPGREPAPEAERHSDLNKDGCHIYR